jgi:hypothetical protein
MATMKKRRADLRSGMVEASALVQAPLLEGERRAAKLDSERQANEDSTAPPTH